MLKLYKNEYKEKKSKEKKMKAVIAIDSLKGSLSSMEAGYAAADGIRRVHGQDAEIIVRPLADGGEGCGEGVVLCVFCPCCTDCLDTQRLVSVVYDGGFEVFIV